jgi:hypothetical protein
LPLSASAALKAVERGARVALIERGTSAESRPQVPRWRAYTWGAVAALT